MPRRNLACIVLGVSTLAIAPLARAIPLLTPGDPIKAIDTDPGASTSSFPGGENPPKLIDGDTNTKYLNFGGTGTGFIITPAAASIVQSFRLTTANDAAERDPSSFALFGTNAAIVSGSNSNGLAEAWTPIAGGPIVCPAARFTNCDTVNVVNGTLYTSYKMFFPSIKGGTIMQVSEAQFFTAANLGGSAILAAANPIVAIDNPTSSSYPANEEPPKVIDGNNATKYLNFGQKNSGFIVTPAVGASNVTGFTVVSANDAVERDPNAYSLFGTNDAIQSGDNSFGDLENWTLISSGAINLPPDRNAPGDPVNFANDAFYKSYRMVFTGVKDAAAANSMQLSEIQFVGNVPEPASMSLLLAGGLLVLARRRRA